MFVKVAYDFGPDTLPPLILPPRTQADVLLGSAVPPGRILTRHSSNQHAELFVNLGASDASGSGLPAPIALEALSVPLNHGFWLNDD